jgi:hypothetical protein
MANVTSARDLREKALNLVALAIIATDDFSDGEESGRPSSNVQWLLDSDPGKMKVFIGWLNYSTGLQLDEGRDYSRWSVSDFADTVYEHLQTHPNQQISPAPLSEMQWAAAHNISVGGQPGSTI